MTFEEWWERNWNVSGVGHNLALAAWQAAQQAERERLNKALDELDAAFAEFCKKLQLGDEQ